MVDWNSVLNYGLDFSDDHEVLNISYLLENVSIFKVMRVDILFNKIGIISFINSIHVVFVIFYSYDGEDF